MPVRELLGYLPLYMRIWAAAIGPAIAVHLAYNLVITTLSLVFSFVQLQ